MLVLNLLNDEVKKDIQLDNMKHQSCTCTYRYKVSSLLTPGALLIMRDGKKDSKMVKQ